MGTHTKKRRALRLMRVSNLLKEAAAELDAIAEEDARLHAVNHETIRTRDRKKWLAQHRAQTFRTWATQIKEGLHDRPIYTRQ